MLNAGGIPGNHREKEPSLKLESLRIVLVVLVARSCRADGRMEKNMSGCCRESVWWRRDRRRSNVILR